MQQADTLFQEQLNHLTPTLHTTVSRAWTRFKEQLTPELLPLLPSDSKFYARLTYVWACSDYAATVCIDEAPYFLKNQKQFKTTLSSSDYKQRLHLLLEGVDDKNQLEKCLRQFRHQEMLRIAWRDLSHLASQAEIFNELTLLADTCIQAALEKLFSWQCEQDGVPVNDKGQKQTLCVITVGKLGGEELNFSSDIDLIFAYPNQGDTEGKAHSISNQDFFQKLAQALIQVISRITEEGFVFRVDMRLRPYGDGGPLVMSFAALEDYYQQQGRDWERYALIKARIIGLPNEEYTHRRLENILRPFVFRRYVDYGAIDALREMKELLMRDVRVRSLQDDIKRGAGGIRQIEFFVQVLQLLRGGQDRYLQQGRLSKVLTYLRDNDIIESHVVDELEAAYCFLRKLEHRLQMLADQQTHTLPNDELSQLRVALSMGYDNPVALEEELARQRKCVSQHFSEMLSAKRKNPKHSDEQLKNIRAIWVNFRDEENSIAALQRWGYQEPEVIYELLSQFINSSRCRTLTKKARTRLDQLIPYLLLSVAEFSDAEAVMRRLIHFLEAIVKRSVYLVLLLEYTDRLKTLLTLFSSSQWIADTITGQPILLDDLIHAPILQKAKTTRELSDSLRQRLLSLPETDLEKLMDVLRRFKAEQVLRTAAAEINQSLSVMQVSEHLSATAETVLSHAQLIALQAMLMNESTSLENTDIDFAIIAYGKLGSRELTYGSDLDLVFLHDSQLENEVTYVRLAQRIIHIVNMRTAAGILYQVDTRLRPSGSSGLLVSSFDAFEHYQEESAWTWEHQALVRARMILGSRDLCERFATLRKNILTRQRDVETLQNDILEMREKMTDAQNIPDDVFDVKYSRGGLVDIEFYTQYLVLARSHEFPQLCTYTNTIHLLNAAGKLGVIEKAHADHLIQAYTTFRSLEHRAILQKEAAQVPEGEFKDLRAWRDEVWC